MLGIIIGIASVLAMIAIGDGAKMIVLRDAEKLGGINQFRMYRSSRIRRGNRWVRNRTNEYFKYEDVLAIEAGCPSIEAVVPSISQRRGVLMQAADGAETRGGYSGVNAAYAQSMHWSAQQGRFLSDEDISHRTSVCVLGHQVATELFGNRDPLGQEIKIARGEGSRFRRGDEEGQRRSTERFTVVGVMEARGTSLRFGYNLDDDVFIPLTTVQDRFTGNDQIDMLTVVAKDLDLVYTASAEVDAVMRKQHHGHDDFYRVRFMQEGMEQLTRISKMIKIALGSIAGFSLLVGGIGIMNMMLVSVTERTREIGLRKAIGAKRRDILFQFLVEAVIICSAGGILGLGLGVGAGVGMAQIAVKIVKIVPEWPAAISTQWMVISIGFSAAIGIMFGVYPAVKASRLSPIEALRTE